MLNNETFFPTELAVTKIEEVMQHDLSPRVEITPTQLEEFSLTFPMRNSRLSQAIVALKTRDLLSN